MKRSTLSLLLTGAILLIGGGILWMVIFAPRLRQRAQAPTPGPATSTPETPPSATEVRYDALNVYLTAPAVMPSGAVRVELTLVKATLIRSDGVEASVFDGVQRVMLQAGSIEKVLSEAVPRGAWRTLKLEFAPVAQASMPDGSVTTALVERRVFTLSIQADLPVSRSLAVFARVPLGPELKDAGSAKTADILPDAQPAETYVFGSFQLDPRGRGNLWTTPEASLPAAIKADLGFDIVTKLKGSGGFVSPTGPAVQATPTP
jgi:hypothetical protein